MHKQFHPWIKLFVLFVPFVEEETQFDNGDMRGGIRVGELDRSGRGWMGDAGCVVAEVDDSASGAFKRVTSSLPVEGGAMDGIGDD